MENIGYLKRITMTSNRVWKLYDADGREIKTGDCIDCTITAHNRAMRILTIH